jgi:hypothetical protein
MSRAAFVATTLKPELSGARQEGIGELPENDKRRSPASRDAGSLAPQRLEQPPLCSTPLERLARGSAAPSTDAGSTEVSAGASGNTLVHGSPAISKLASVQHTSQKASAGSAFGRMFPSLAAYSPSDQALVNLAPGVPGRPNVNPNNGTIAAGLTYVGQIIDHDLTFDRFRICSDRTTRRV